MDSTGQEEVVAQLNRLLCEVHMPIPSGLLHITDLTPSLLLALTSAVLRTPLLPLPRPRPSTSISAHTRPWELAALATVLSALSRSLPHHLQLDIVRLADADEAELWQLAAALVRAAEGRGWLRPERYRSTPRKEQPPSPSPPRTISSLPTTRRSDSRASAASGTATASTVRQTASRTSRGSRGSTAATTAPPSTAWSASSPATHSTTPASPSLASTSTTSHAPSETAPPGSTHSYSYSYALPPSPTPVRSRSATPSATFEEVRALSRQGGRSGTPSGSMEGRTRSSLSVASRSGTPSAMMREGRGSGRRSSTPDEGRTLSHSHSALGIGIGSGRKPRAQAHPRGPSPLSMDDSAGEGEYYDDEEVQEVEEDEDEDEDEGAEGYLEVVDDVPSYEQTRLSISARSLPSARARSSTVSPVPLTGNARASTTSADVERQRRYELLQRKAELLRQLAEIRLQARGIGLDIWYAVEEREEREPRAA